jgi:hypothetical protein
MGPGPVQAQVARVENQARRRIPSRKRTMNRHRPLLPSHLLTLLSPHYPPGGLFPSTNTTVRQRLLPLRRRLGTRSNSSSTAAAQPFSSSAPMAVLRNPI